MNEKLGLDESLVENIKAGTFNNSSYFGYKSKVLKSGICKYYRRKKFDKFEWCVIEMMLFGLKNKGLLTNLLNRLKIVLMEEIVCYDIGEVCYCIKLFNDIDNDGLDLDDKMIKVLEICSIIKHVRRGRIVSYINCWWKYHTMEYDLMSVSINKVKKFSKKNDSEELLKYGELFIGFMESNDERIFDIYQKLYAKTENYGSRYRRKDGVFLLFEIIEDKYKSNPQFMILFEFIKTMFFRKGMTERRAFGVWLMLIVWKFDTLDFSTKYMGVKMTKSQLKTYMASRTKIIINESYVVEDYHINKKFGLAGFGNHGSKVIDEDLSILGENGTKYKQLYIDDKNGKVNTSKKLSTIASSISKSVIELGVSSFIKSRKKHNGDTLLEKHNGNTSKSNMFSEKHDTMYLKGYIKHKPNSYETLQNAKNNSNHYNDVGGITFSKKKKFTLRKGTTLKPSTIGESSWVKLNTKTHPPLMLNSPKKKKKKFNVKKSKVTTMKISLDDYTITQMSADEYETILNLPQGQKLTSSSKKSVYMDKINVYKGPFIFDDKKLLNSIKFTQALIWVESVIKIPDKMKCVLPFSIKEYKGYYFLVYKNIGIIDESSSELVDTTLVSKSLSEMALKLGNSIPSKSVKIYPRGVINRISDIITLDPSKFTDDIKLATLQHLYFRYLFNIGDSGTQNVLYREDGHIHLVAGIDMEEIRGKDQGNTKLEYLFNSRYNKKVALFKDMIDNVVTLTFEELDTIKDDLALLGIDSEDIRKKIYKFNTSKSNP